MIHIQNTLMLKSSPLCDVLYNAGNLSIFAALHVRSKSPNTRGGDAVNITLYKPMLHRSNTTWPEKPLTMANQNSMTYKHILVERIQYQFT